MTMIRKSIEPETKVFNEIYGIGIFKGWNDYGDAIIQFNDHITKPMMRKNLTEIENDH